MVAHFMTRMGWLPTTFLTGSSSMRSVIISIIIQLVWSLMTMSVPPAAQGLVLLAPPASHYGVYNALREELFDFYVDFYHATQAANESIVLIVTGIPHWLDAGSRVELIRRGIPDDVLLARQLDDIWIRDFFPTQISSGSSSNHDDDTVAEFRYYPAYLDAETVRYIDASTQHLLDYLQLPGLTEIFVNDNDSDWNATEVAVQTSTNNNNNIPDDDRRLILDGGGIVVEPESAVAVVTERVLRDNPALVGRPGSGLGPAEECCPADPYNILSQQQPQPQDPYGKFTANEIAVAENRLATLLNLQAVVVVPEEPDVPRLGHVDGIANWLAPGVLALSNFSNPTVYQRYATLLESKFRDTIPSLQIVPFPYAVVDEAFADGFESAQGIYVNFLRTPHALYLPIFDTPVYDQMALTLARQHANRPVYAVNASQVAIMGGSVRCLSQQFWGANADAIVKGVQRQKQREEEAAANHNNSGSGGAANARYSVAHVVLWWTVVIASLFEVTAVG